MGEKNTKHVYRINHGYNKDSSRIIYLYVLINIIVRGNAFYEKNSGIIILHYRKHGEVYK